MPVEDDVAVVGGGLAGMTAALSAARAGADRVRLVSHKRSSLRQASGLIDVLGYADGEGPLADPFAAIPSLPESHPYRTVGVEAVRAALRLFDSVVGDAYRGGHTDANALVPVVGGAVKPTARYPASVAPGLASDDRPALLVGFESDPDFDAPLAAAHLRGSGVPFDVRGVTVRFPGDVRDDAAVTRLASALDRDETVSDGRGVRAALADRIRPHLDAEARVGLPALLGQDHPSEVRAALSAALDADVFEVPTGPPSVPGLRLESQLQAALRDAGVRLTLGDPVVGADGDRRIRALAVDREGRTVEYAPGAVVLATGGLVGTGIDSDRDSVAEPAFGCHVPAPSDRPARAAEAPFGDHAFARFGVRTDGDLRPVDAAGDPEFGNLFAAGSVLGGYDFAAEKSGSGVSLSTGLVAGRRAAEVVA